MLPRTLSLLQRHHYILSQVSGWWCYYSCWYFVNSLILNNILICLNCSPKHNVYLINTTYNRFYNWKESVWGKTLDLLPSNSHLKLAVIIQVHCYVSLQLAFAYLSGCLCRMGEGDIRSEFCWRQRITQAKINGEKGSNACKVNHLWVCSTDIHCLSLSTCSRMVSFYKMFVFLHFT